MNTLLKHLALAGLVLLSAGGASAAVTVAFSHPENFRDMPFSPTDRERVLKELGDHFALLGKDLPPGQDLRIEVLDLDLAGRIHHSFRGRDDIRVMRGGADWPRMQLRYSLESQGHVIASGEDHLSDMMYMNRLNRYSDGETLRYEKRMIDDWFKEKFGAAQARLKPAAPTGASCDAGHCASSLALHDSPSGGRGAERVTSSQALSFRACASRSPSHP